jgi:hypothetical protein
MGNAADDQSARRAAARVGLRAKKSRRRANSINNFGGFALVDPGANFVVAGARFDMTAADVVAWCKGSKAAAQR